MFSLKSMGNALAGAASAAATAASNAMVAGSMYTDVTPPATHRHHLPTDPSPTHVLTPIPAVAVRNESAFPVLVVCSQLTRMYPKPTFAHHP